MKRCWFALLFVVFLFSSCALGQRIGRGPVRSETKDIEIGGIRRSYNIFVPSGLSPDKKVPLVFVFHGGRGTSLRTERSTRFSMLAEKEKFIVVYPQGLRNHWNDGRRFQARRGGGSPEEDVAFIKAVLEEVNKAHKIDENGIYSTGASNGGFFSNLLGAKMASRFAAIAPVIGGISDGLAKEFAPAEPVSVLIIQGTDDPLVPYAGGTVARNRGSFIGTDNAVKLWTRNDGIDKDPIKGKLADIDKNDGCDVDTFVWQNGKNGTEVALYKMNGGGHAWPGGSQYLPWRIIGGVCRDFDATRLIWEFFKAHPKRRK